MGGKSSGAMWVLPGGSGHDVTGSSRGLAMQGVPRRLPPAHQLACRLHPSPHPQPHAPPECACSW